MSKNDKIGNFHAVSCSGGKDSTAMLLLMIERDMPIDVVLTSDTGMYFPEMYEHIHPSPLHMERVRITSTSFTRCSTPHRSVMVRVPQSVRKVWKSTWCSIPLT